MIIDDEASICKALYDFLDDFDEFDLRTVPSAEGALAELARRPADVCVVDLRLPGMNGVELVRKLVTDNLCSRNIVHTASLDFELTCELRSLGITQEDIVRKPSWNMSILHRIRSLTGLPEHHDAFPRHE
jgi:DNA-binding NtrC family response regulator